MTTSHTKKKKNEKKPNQSMLKALFMTVLAFIARVTAWNEDKQRGTPAITVRKGEKGIYNIFARSADEITSDEAQNALQAALAGKTVEQKKGDNPYLAAVEKVLSKLSMLGRYNGMKVARDGANTLLVHMPKGKFLNYTIQDFKVLLNLAETQIGKKRVQTVAELNLTMQLLAMQGELPLKAGETPAVIVAYGHTPKGKKKPLFPMVKVIASLFRDGNKLEWRKGGRELTVRTQNGKTVTGTTINNILKKAEFKRKGENKVFQVRFDRKTMKYKWNEAQAGLSEAVDAGVFGKGKYTFDPHGLGEHFCGTLSSWRASLAGILASMTNGVSTGTGHIIEKAQSKMFPNISWKRLLEGHPEEVNLLNDENKALLAQIREALGMSEYRIPALIRVGRPEIDYKSPQFMAMVAAQPQVQAIGQAYGDEIEPEARKAAIKQLSHAEFEAVPIPGFNRWWKFTGNVSTIAASDITDEENNIVLMDLLCVETSQEATTPPADS